MEEINKKKDTFDFQKYLESKLKNPTFRKYYDKYGKQLEAIYHISGVKCQLSNVNCPRTRGALLLELLIVTSILAVILSIGSQAVYVSMQSGKTSAESDVATGLASEALEATRAVADEKWQNIYNLTGKGSTRYYATSTAPALKWTIVATAIPSDEQIVMNGIVYTRYIIVENVNRNAATRGIDPAGDEDPSTQKVTVTVSWTNADTVIISDYFFRWRNKICSQTGWDGLYLSGNTVLSCGTTRFNTIDSTVSTSTGTLRLQ
ncbi:MAG: type II secretion system GspH family protein [Candidatus Roizmanbacteria bacterium]|nr:type II secretion system GspH family protein [Candidatus Roizmanbacteria bacterium]